MDNIKQTAKAVKGLIELNKKWALKANHKNLSDMIRKDNLNLKKRYYHFIFEK